MLAPISICAIIHTSISVIMSTLQGEIIFLLSSHRSSLYLSRIYLKLYMLVYCHIAESIHFFASLDFLWRSQCPSRLSDLYCIKNTVCFSHCDSELFTYCHVCVCILQCSVSDLYCIKNTGCFSHCDSELFTYCHVCVCILLFTYCHVCILQCSVLKRT